MVADLVLNPIDEFRKSYDEVIDNRVFKFDARTINEWAEWRNRFRAKLLELLGFPYGEDTLKVIHLGEADYGGFTVERIAYRSFKDVYTPALILKPSDARAPYPAVVVLHGHGCGVNSVMGLCDINVYKGMAVELVKRGFLVIAPELAGFGERRERKDMETSPSANSCHILSFWLIMMGRTVMGLRVWDAIRALEYLLTRSDVDADRIGIIGFSLGGAVSMFTAAIDDRIKAAAIGGFINTFRDSFLSVKHCICNLIPGILRYCESYDVASLIAPRPLLIFSGENDPIYPKRGVLKAYEEISKVYKFLGAEDRLSLHIYSGGHEAPEPKVYVDWFKKWLNS